MKEKKSIKTDNNFIHPTFSAAKAAPLAGDVNVMRKNKIIKFIILGLAITNAICSYAYATIQEKDEIIYETKTYTIEEVPLNEYFEKLDPIPEFDVPNTANYKGYTAKWEIRNDELYLIAFQAKRQGKDVHISEIFPNSVTLPIKADWYSGDITINLEELQFHYGEFLSPTVIILKVENGKIIAKEKTKNKKLITNQSSGL